MEEFRRILSMKECYHRKNSCKDSNFSSLKTIEKITQNMIRYFKKENLKLCNFFGLKIITNICKTFLFTLLSLPLVREFVSLTKIN